MIEPSITLAVSVQSNPGVYALLLGSGISRSSGVPTGWEIVTELIRQLATLQNQDASADPEGWYRATYGRGPDYSEILNDLARSPSERMQLLRGYFEPTEEERQEGRKLPTPAHRAIAELAAKGYFRVIITTNFDRLLESALGDVGIQPFVISTPDAANGALPLAHSRCTIIKVNGDYLDSRLKNTGDELAHYDEPIERLLDQVVNEYGLIVCGWSGEWDTALRSALERCPTRRFTTYWTTTSRLGQKAQDLATHRQAVISQIAGADVFFSDLRGKISALEDITSPDVLSAKVAVARVKKYLADSSQRISLHDLVTRETEKAHSILTGSIFPATVPSLSAKDVLAIMQKYEAAMDTLLHLLICCAYWGEPEHDALVLRSFKRISDQEQSQTSLVILANLKRYPALFLLYGVGIAALSRNNYRFVKALFGLKVKYDAYQPEKPVAAAIHDQAVLGRDQQRQILGKNRYTPISDGLFELLRDPLREYLPGESEYDQTFDWFEYLLCLCHCDAGMSRSDIEEQKAKNPDFTLWASVGRFGWKSHYDGEPNIQSETELVKGQLLPEKVAALITAGFFESAGQHDDKYREVKAAFDRLTAVVRRQWVVF